MTHLTNLPNELLTPKALRETLNRWHQAPVSERSERFPGPFAEKSKLDSWLGNISSRCTTQNPPIPQVQWVNVTLSWIPVAEEGKTGFRERLLTNMKKKRRMGEWEIGRFWDWGEFLVLFFDLCALINKRHRLKMALYISGGAAVGGIAVATTGATAGSQSMVYLSSGVAALLWWSGIGARSAITAYNCLASVFGVGAAAVTVIGTGKGEHKMCDSVDSLGDIGDDGDYFLGDLGDDDDYLGGIGEDDPGYIEEKELGDVSD